MNQFLQGPLTFVRLEMCNAFIKLIPSPRFTFVHTNNIFVQVKSAALKLIFLSYQETGRPQTDKKAKVGFSELNITTAVMKGKILYCNLKFKIMMVHFPSF